MQLEPGSEPTPRWWDDVDRLFASLPPALFRQLKLLEYDLALENSPSGQFHDIFSTVNQPPMLSVASWLFADLDVPRGAVGEANRHLFVASVVLAARVQVVHGLRDAGGFTAEDRIALVQWLSERSAAEIGRVVAGNSPYWDSYDTIVRDEAERLAAWSAGDADALQHEPESLIAGPISAPLRLVALAALAAVDRLDLAARTDTMLSLMADAYQVMRDLASFRRDAELGRVSYPIAFVVRAAQLPARPVPAPEVVLGAMVATRSLGRIVESALERVRGARTIAVELGLPTYASFLADAEAHFAAAGEEGGLARVFAPPPMPSVSHALQMAQGYLLADPTFRESWETHREGMLGQSLVASRFPMGLVLEMLCRHGLDVRRAIDEFLAFSVANRFRYYDHPRSGIDSDTVGIVLRLGPFATPSPARDLAVADLLECLGRNVKESGAIPVWITGCAGTAESESGVIALGEHCGTVAAHLLLGLLAAGVEQEATAIGTKSFVDRLGAVGLAVNVNYPPAFALGVFFRLLRRLAAPDRPAFRQGIEPAFSAMNAALQAAVSKAPTTAQDAALLTLACLEADRRDLIDPAWRGQMLKRQRFDGSWAGEAFAAAPNRGRSVSWYSSTLLTTALCYDALAREAKPPAAVAD